MNAFCGDVDCYLFDLDGTLLDSNALHESAYRQTLFDQRPELLMNFAYSAIAGLTTASAFRSLGLGEDAIARATAQKQALYREMIDSGQLKSLPGALNLLEDLTKAGAKIAVVTSARRVTAIRALAACALAPFVDEIVAAEDCAHSKPMPAPFVTALDRLNKHGQHNSVAVEDSKSGIASAHAAGLKVVGVHQTSIQALADIFLVDFHAFREALR